jgi:hypothetical protein
MNNTEKLDVISEEIKNYLLLNYGIVKLEVTKKTAEVASSLFSATILGISLFIFVFSLSIGLGFYLSALLGDSYSGFGIIAGFYLLITLILLVTRKALIEKPMRNKIVRKILETKKS